MKAVRIILKSFSNLRTCKYYQIISKCQVAKQKEHKQTPFFFLKKKFNINYSKTKIMFLKEMFQLSNGQQLHPAGHFMKVS